LVTDLAALAPPRHDQVERAIWRLRDPPGERLASDEAVVLRRPGRTAVRGLEDAAAEAAGVERPPALRARGIDEDVRRRGLRQAGARDRPALAAVGRHADAALELVGVGVAP